MAQFTASLSIGGTGMLAAATRWLLASSGTTLLVARHASAVAPDAGVVAVDADWTGAGFAEVIEAALDRMPPMDAALLWLHEPAPVIAWLLPRLPGVRVVLVLGSMSGNRRGPAVAGRIATVRLGSLPTARGRRWLTHEEISAAAIASLQDGESRTVGELKPAC